MQKRRRIKQTTTLQERLAEFEKTLPATRRMRRLLAKSGMRFSSVSGAPTRPQNSTSSLAARTSFLEVFGAASGGEQ